ncbi:MAG: hypothetical protein WD826_10480 [Actinomycetota bacterium]
MRVHQYVPEARSGAKDITIAIALLLFAAVLIRDGQVPLLAYVDLGFHELGHLLTYPFPDLVTAVAGSFFQVAVPVGLAAYFFAFRGDESASALMFGWAATSSYSVATYIADAPYERLELIGGDHDWAHILFTLDQIDAAAPLATAVRVLAWLMLLSAGVLLAHPYLKRIMSS